MTRIEIWKQLNRGTFKHLREHAQDARATFKRGGIPYRELRFIDELVALAKRLLASAE